MAVANKAFVWLLFAAGGTLTALILPVVIVLYLLVASGQVPPGLDHGPVLRFATSWLGGTALFVFISLSAWHAAHRIRVLMHDLGVRADRLVAYTVYAGALVATALCLGLLTIMAQAAP